MATDRGTDADDVREIFDPGDENKAREDAAISVALDVAADFVTERFEKTAGGYDEVEKLASFEPWVAAHVLHAPYPHADDVDAGDASVSFAGGGLGESEAALDADGLRETRYGRMVLFMDTADALLTSKEGSTFEAFGPVNDHRGR